MGMAMRDAHGPLTRVLGAHRPRAGITKDALKYPSRHFMKDIVEVKASFVEGEVPHAMQALDAAEYDVAMINVGGLRFLEEALSLFKDVGFVLINDYGPTTISAFDLHTFIHRFGGTITCAL